MNLYQNKDKPQATFLLSQKHTRTVDRKWLANWSCEDKRILGNDKITSEVCNEKCTTFCVC